MTTPYTSATIHIATTIAGAAMLLTAGGAVAAPVALSGATATYSQGGYDASGLTDGSYGGQNGWAIDGGSNTDQRALMLVTAPLAAGEYDVSFDLFQYFDCCGTSHTLGEFSIGYTTDAAPTLTSAQTLFAYTGFGSANGATFTTSGGRIFATLGSSYFETYTVNAYVNAGAAITGIFLNVYNTPGNGYPTDGPGQAFNGNFVVNEVTMNAATHVDSGVPEPTTWALMLLGFGSLGAALRQGLTRGFGDPVGLQVGGIVVQK